MKDSFLYDLVSAVNKSGVVGEQDSILTLLNKVSLRLVKNADAVSSNVIVSDITGSGKDFLVRKVCNLILPKGCCLHRTYLTPAVLIYWSMSINWIGKVLYIEDAVNDLVNCPVFKTMASGGSHATVTMNQKHVDIEIIGKPVIVVTSMTMSVDIEGIRRWDMLGLDSSKELTKAVVNNSLSSHKVVFTVDEKKVLAVVKSLKPLSVSIPFVDKLVGIFPDDLVMRTISKKLLDYIRSSAVLHNRKVATWFDYEYARLCFWKLNSLGNVPLNIYEKEFIDVLHTASYPLSIRDISSRLNRNRKWVYRHKDRLVELGIIEESYEFDESANQEILKLSLLISVGFELPSCAKLSGDVKDFEAFDRLLAKLDSDREKIGLKPVFDGFRR